MKLNRVWLVSQQLRGIGPEGRWDGKDPEGGTAICAFLRLPLCT